MGTDLEQMKSERGGKCLNCRRFLRPDDEDHSFCNECWQLMVQHPWEPDVIPGYEIEDQPCTNCGEEKDDIIHTIHQIVGKCPNCGGVILSGDGPDVHERCADEFMKYLEDSVRPLYDDE